MLYDLFIEVPLFFQYIYSILGFVCLTIVNLSEGKEKAFQSTYTRTCGTSIIYTTILIGKPCRVYHLYTLQWKKRSNIPKTSVVADVSVGGNGDGDHGCSEHVDADNDS